MKTKILLTLLVTFFLQGAYSANMANRALCNPQNQNMAVDGTFISTCEWQKWEGSADADAQITLNGKQVVHAECEFTGPDSIALVRGKKHADVKTMVVPGNKFSFIVGYKNASDESDDNQNILFYLNTSHPNELDKLVCHFSVK